MRAIRSTFLVMVFILLAQKPEAQIISDDRSGPKSQYNVHREYDEHGNLIEYDSVCVTTWNYSGEADMDTISDIWSYTPDPKDSEEFSGAYPKHHSFRFPGDEFYEFPQFNFDFSFNNPDSIFRGFDFYFSLSPGDSIHLNEPYFDFYGQFPPMPPDIHSYIEDMHRMIDDMFNHNEEILREFNEEEFHQMSPDEPSKDSIPAEPTPPPSPQKYSGPLFNI